MGHLGLRPGWLTVVLALGVAIIMAGCGGDDPEPAAEPSTRPAAAVEAPAWPTPNPTATPEPAPTNTPAPTPTPDPTNTPEPTATPVLPPSADPDPPVEPPDSSTGAGGDTEERVRAYAEECAALTAALTGDPMAMPETDPGQTWGEVAELSDLQLETYSQLEPPPEVEEYHHARLETLKAFRDNAKTRPADRPMMMDFQEMMATVFPEMMAVGLDPNKTEEEKQAEIEQIMEEPLMNLLGPDFLEATKAEDEARVRLPENLRNILDETGCSLPDEEEIPFP